jgi:hypothetical protein
MAAVSQQQWRMSVKTIEEMPITLPSNQTLN